MHTHYIRNFTLRATKEQVFPFLRQNGFLCSFPEGVLNSIYFSANSTPKCNHGFAINLKLEWHFAQCSSRWMTDYYHFLFFCHFMARIQLLGNSLFTSWRISVRLVWFIYALRSVYKNSNLEKDFKKRVCPVKCRRYKLHQIYFSNICMEKWVAQKNIKACPLFVFFRTCSRF